jgi:hypothetical protein
MSQVVLSGPPPGSSRWERCGVQRVAKSRRNKVVVAERQRTRASSGTDASRRANLQSLAPFETRYQKP